MKVNEDILVEYIDVLWKMMYLYDLDFCSSTLLVEMMNNVTKQRR